MRLLILLAVIFLTLSCSKKSGDGPGGGCGDLPVETVQSFFYPIWHPNGEILVFNYFPVSGILNTPCSGPRFTFKQDSIGLYTFKKDRTDFTRVTDKVYYYSSWSPDGSKLAVLEHGKLSVIPFDGTRLDTTNQQLVLSGSLTNRPLFNSTGDSLYVQLFVNSKTVLYKVALDGGKTEISQGAFREMSVGSNGRLYYLSDAGEIWSMNSNAHDLKKEVANIPGDYEQKRSPRFYNGNIYYVKGNKLIYTGSDIPVVSSDALDFDISPQGELVYTLFNFNISESNKQNGVLWIMNLDGTNKRQLTFNYF